MAQSSKGSPRSQTKEPTADTDSLTQSMRNVDLNVEDRQAEASTSNVGGETTPPPYSRHDPNKPLPAPTAAEPNERTQASPMTSSSPQSPSARNMLKGFLSFVEERHAQRFEGRQRLVQDLAHRRVQRADSLLHSAQTQPAAFLASPRAIRREDKFERKEEKRAIKREIRDEKRELRKCKREVRRMSWDARGTLMGEGMSWHEAKNEWKGMKRDLKDDLRQKKGELRAERRSLKQL
ncbi:hypothetical protein BT69DRAFT_1276493 [Atractiella rhizophila]|nr:hypothetical protein BT69DRAFT_1276493 [Atractiella rhizophila]